MKRLLFFLVAICLSFNVALSEGIDLSQMTPDELAELQSRIQAEMDSRPEDYDYLITQALEVFKAGWNEEYENYPSPEATYLIDIRGVRLIRIKDTLGEKESTIFGDAKYLIEFLFYDDYFSTPSVGQSGHKVGYLDYSGQKDTVVIHQDGSMSLESHLIRNYVSRYYENDFTGFVEEVIDFRDQYNQIIEFPQGKGTKQ